MSGAGHWVRPQTPLATHERQDPAASGENWGPLRLLAGTQLRLQLALFRDPPELAALTAILEGDPVAVLQLFALAAESLQASCALAEAPLRIEELIVLSGRRRLLDFLCAQTPALGSEGEVMLDFAQRARVFGALCRTVAETVGLPQDKSYLVGLLHNIGVLPWHLGWPVPPRSTLAEESATLALSRQYALPQELRQALRDVAGRGASSPWTAMVLAAQELLATAAANTGPLHPVRLHARGDGVAF